MVLQLVLPHGGSDNMKHEPPITPDYIHYGKVTAVSSLSLSRLKTLLGKRRISGVQLQLVVAQIQTDIRVSATDCTEDKIKPVYADILSYFQTTNSKIRQQTVLPIHGYNCQLFFSPICITQRYLGTLEIQPTFCTVNCEKHQCII